MLFTIKKAQFFADYLILQDTVSSKFFRAAQNTLNFRVITAENATSKT